MLKKPLHRFIFFLFFGYITWSIVDAVFILENGVINSSLRSSTAWIGMHFTALFDAETSLSELPDQSMICVYGHDFIGIKNACNGLVLFAVYSIFIIAFPAKLKIKMYALLFGNIIIYFTNVIRMLGLIVIKIYWPEYLEFNHHYTFQLFIYGVIFFMWRHFTNINIDRLRSQKE